MLEIKKELGHCVEVNIVVKCKDNSWKKEKEAPCVVVNIHAECGECEKKKEGCDED